jgi:hypothetical protein
MLYIKSFNELLFEKKDNKKKTLFMTIGISGTGKTRYFKKKLSEKFPEIKKKIGKSSINDVIVCPDEIRKEVKGDINNTNNNRIWEIVEQRTKQILKKYGICIVGGVNTSLKRNKFLDKVTDKNTDKISLVFKPNVEISKKRIKKDIENNIDRSDVPDIILKKQYQEFKKTVINDDNWNGEWDNNIKKTITKNLKNKFNKIYFV